MRSSKRSGCRATSGTHTRPSSLSRAHIPRVFFHRVPEGKTVKNRVHFDVRVVEGLKGDERMNALDTAANLLEAIGATRSSAVLASETPRARNVLSHAYGSHGRDEVEEDG